MKRAAAPEQLRPPTGSGSGIKTGVNHPPSTPPPLAAATARGLVILAAAARWDPGPRPTPPGERGREGGASIRGKSQFFWKNQRPHRRRGRGQALAVTAQLDRRDT